LSSNMRRLSACVINTSVQESTNFK
jgi:hypothetical protein